MERLTEIANKYGTDKGTNFAACHGYTEIYPKYIPESPEKCLEIGVRSGASLKMWGEYFSSLTTIYGIDDCSENLSVEHFKRLQKENNKFKILIADQSKRENLKEAVEIIGKESLDFILDDGSHYVDHQQISLATLFCLLKPGGLYIIEDITDKAYPSGGWNIKDMVNYSDATVNVLDYFSCTGQFISPYVKPDEQKYLEEYIDRVILELHNSGNMAFIYKK